ncbi:MAG: molecular chaperone HtpG [Christensenellaceae bacterium]|jgi:molecular chaperone HtpG|nr:molecular chaperone HtpG [Christensenellaceae bacterium]
MERGSLSIHAENLLPIIKKWLYSDQDIFVRELCSNAADAIAKRRALGLMGGEAPRVEVIVNKSENTLSFIDNGIGMTAEEIKKYINQIAFSGASEFLEKLSESGEQIIGHFGLGFYSAFMVAEKVRIETLSAQGGPAAAWESEGGMEYAMEEIERASVGSTIKLYLNAEAKAFLEGPAMRELLLKYCSFLQVPIYLREEGPEEAKAGEEAEEGEKAEEKPVNTPSPLYTKQPSGCTEGEYKAFYREIFMDFEEPLFWIHLNVDYPFNLKGILYFPRVRPESIGNEGQVKLYSNQVFVADNIKEVIPEFLLLLKGVIDCPDLPLNVSRSFLQNDGYVRRISDYITRKVADRLTALFKEDRKAYEGYWDDLHFFIKYGCIRDEKFYERMKDCLLYQTSKGESLTLQEVLERAKEGHENQVFYAPNQQGHSLALSLYEGMDVVLLGTPIDNAFIQQIEGKNPGLRFIRVDSQLSDALKGEGEVSAEDASALETLFKWALGDESAQIRVERLRENALPALLLQDENLRRYAEAMRLYGGSMPDFPIPSTLALNLAHPLVSGLVGREQSDDTRALCLEIRDLAELSLQPLIPEKMTEFLLRTTALLAKLI